MYLCSGEISSKGLLCTVEEKVQHKGKDGKRKLEVAFNEKIRQQV